MGLEVSQRNNRLELITNWDLFERLQSPNLIDSQFEELFTVFYHRFKDRLYRRCYEITTRNEHLALDLFQETMIKAIKSVKKTRFNSSLSEEEIGDKVVAWLGVILNNEFINYIRGRKKEVMICELDSSFDEFETNYDIEYEDEVKQNYSFLRVKFDSIFSNLSEREQYILLMCANYNCLFNNDHLPDEVVKDICRQFNITSNYLRLLKKRAIAKFNSH